MTRQQISDEYNRVNRKFEKLFLPKVRKALSSKKRDVVVKLQNGGIDHAIHYLQADVGNEFLHDVVYDIYKIVGVRHARMNYSRMLHDEKGYITSVELKGFGFNEIWTNYVLAYLRDFLLQKITYDVAATTRAALLAILSTSVIEGWSIDQTINKVEGWDERYQAARVVRTEVNRAANVGAKANSETLKYQQVKEWISAEDDRVRGKKPKDHANHVKLDKTTIDAEYKFVDSINGDRLDFPGDITASAASTINCFPGNTLIEGQIIGAQKLKYSGKLFEIITASGKRLSLTANHTVFTNRGTIPVHLLCNGDYVLSNIKKADDLIPLRSTNDYIYKKPIIAANIFSSLSNSFCSQKIVTVSLDFNGDSEFGDGYVNVIDMNRELEFSNEMDIQDIGKFDLKTTNLERVLISTFCSQNFFSIGNNSTLSGRMSCGTLNDSFIPTHLRPFKFLSIGTSTHWNTSRFKMIDECGTNDSTFLRELFHGNPGVVSFDEIVKIRNYNFTGHVYDFSTLSGAILANGIHISNCRCQVAYYGKRDSNGNLIPKRTSTAVIYPGGIPNRQTILI